MSLGQKITSHQFQITIKCTLTISPHFGLLITVETVEKLLKTNQAETLDWHVIKETEGRYSVGISFHVEYAYNSLFNLVQQINLLETSYVSLHVRQNIEENNTGLSISVPFICDYEANGANGDTLVYSQEGPVFIAYNENKVVKSNFSWYITPFLPSDASNNILCGVGRSSYV